MENSPSINIAAGHDIGSPGQAFHWKQCICGRRGGKLGIRCRREQLALI